MRSNFFWEQVGFRSDKQHFTKMSYKFCPNCGHKFFKKKIHNRPRLVCSSCDFIFYENSRPTASALIIDGDKVLLAKRKFKPAKGKWDIPGGFLEAGEHPDAGMLREVKEETGLEVKIIDMIGFFIDRYGKEGDYTLNIAYIAKIKKGKRKPADDVDELRWFKLTELPQNLAFKNGREMLQTLKKWIRIQSFSKPPHCHLW